MTVFCNSIHFLHFVYILTRTILAVLFVSPSKTALEKFYVYCPPLLLDEIYAPACAVCLRAESALVGADCPLCERLSLRMLALRGLSLRRELSPAFLAVPTPHSARRSGGCARGNRRWIRWRGRRRASPYRLPFPSDTAPALWDWKSALQFLPTRESARRSACLPPRRWTWRTLMSFVSCSVCTSIVCTSILWTRI